MGCPQGRERASASKLPYIALLLRLELLLVSVCLLANLISYAKQVNANTHVSQKHAIKSNQFTNKRVKQKQLNIETQTARILCAALRVATPDLDLGQLLFVC